MPCRGPRPACLLLVSALSLVAAPSGAQDAPAGHLLVIGGGNRPPSIMRLFACLAGGASGKVLVFPQASERAEAGAELREEMVALGLEDTVVVGADRVAADRDETLRLTEGATGVFFGGGDQVRLMAALHGTRLEARLRALYRQGAVIAGTSAGAAVMSRVMITGDEQRPLSKDDNWQIIETDDVVTAEGLGFLDQVIVDQHFVRRRRHNRLLSLVLQQPGLLGVAIDEETAAWVKPDRSFEVVGNGPLLVFDAAGARTQRDADGHGLRGSDLRLHVLRAGARYDLVRRSVTRLASPTAETTAACPAR